MFERKERLAVILFVAALAVVAVLALGGCESAEESSTTGSVTETTVAPTDTTAGEGTETTAAEGTGTTTAGTPTTVAPGGGESVAPVSEQFKVCTDCHSNFNAFLEDQNVLVDSFSHALHLNKGIRCEDCHLVPTHGPDQINKPTMLKCFSCHSQEANAVAPGECSACHPKDFPLVPENHNQAGWLPPENQTGVKTVSAKHSDMAMDDPKYCAMCHAQSFCQGCHKMQMPHPGDWQQTHPQTVAELGKQSCAQCHPDEYLCNDCHHTGYKNDGTGWQSQHPPIVTQNGAEDCFSCHNPLTCAHCHITGKLDMNLSPGGGSSAPASTTTTTAGS